MPRATEGLRGSSSAATALVGYGRRVARRTRSRFAALARRGPHKVLRGDLAFAGIPGQVYTPAAGLNLPAVAFGHDWLTGADRYTGTLEHLASWGIVAALPDTQRGPAPSAVRLAHDLSATLGVICRVRLGDGQVSVAPGARGVAGHGFGGAAAVLAAGRSAAVVAAAVFPAVTTPAAPTAASALRMPGLVLATPDDAVSLRTDALEVAHNWDGAVLRVVDRARATGLAEGRRLRRLLGLPGSSTRTQRTVRALLTGFFLYHLAGDEDYREFADPAARLPRTSLPDPAAPPVSAEDRIVALLR